MERDRNLLFGVMAVQLRRVTPAQLVEVAAAWATDPSRDLADRLVEAGALSARDRELLERLVGEAVAAHDGDATATLSLFGGDDVVRHSFCGAVERTPSGGGGVSSAPTTPPPGSFQTESVQQPEVEEAAGRYTLRSEHGRGGIGRVLVVHDQCLGRDVALKELLPEAGGGASGGQSPVRQSGHIVSRFLQEARVTGQLEHPSIVPVYELGRRRDGSVYYTMKLVRGRSLRQALDQTDTLTARMTLLPHFADLCQAVAYAHSRGVIHRDLKPANVMVGEFGETVVIDWGLAKVRGKEDIHAAEMTRSLRQVDSGGAPARTAYGVAVGTPVYMPPEQARGDVEAVDERSDIYALGAVLYEILTGRVPFDGASVAEVLARVVRDQPRPITAFAPDTPPELVAICERAMAKESAARYQTARELAQEVQRFLSGALVRAYQYRFAEHLRRFLRRHRAVVATASAFALVLAVVLAGAVAWNVRERRRAEREAETATRVSEFLQSVFAVSDPGEARGNSITARELLDRAAERVGRELAGQPAVQARMMTTMGSVYVALGLYEEARPHYEEALRLRRAAGGGDAVELAESLANLATAVAAQGDFDRAEPLLREALEVQRRPPARDTEQLGVTLSTLGSLLQAKGDYAAAEPLHREALEVWRRVLGEEHPLVAGGVGNLGFLLYEKGDYAAAEPLYRDSLAMRRRLLGNDHPEVALTLNNLAALLHAKGDYRAAEPLFREVLELRRRLLGEEHPDVAMSLNNLAAALEDLGDHAAAERLYREALAMWRRLVGEEHPFVASCLNNLGSVLRAMGEDAAAEQMLRDSLAMHRRLLGGAHPSVATALNNLASLLEARGDLDGAEPLFREALAMRQGLLGDRHPAVAQSLFNLGALLQVRGDTAAAEPLLREAVGIWEATLPPENPDRRKAVTAYAALLRSTGRELEARELESRDAAGGRPDPAPAAD